MHKDAFFVLGLSTYGLVQAKPTDRLSAAKKRYLIATEEACNLESSALQWSISQHRYVEVLLITALPIIPTR